MSDKEQKETQKLIDGFFDLVDSLKKCRRADLSDINKDEDIIEKLYIDPLENDFVLKTSLKPNTTILIGRKGTGKSTIIARLQHEIRKSNDKLSLYIDVKTLFDQSRTFSYDSKQKQNVLDQDELEKYFLFTSFLKLLIEEIKEEVKTNTIKFHIASISNIFGIDKDSFRKKIDDIFSEIDKKENIDILILKEKMIKARETSTNEKSISKGGNISLDAVGGKAGTNFKTDSSKRSNLDFDEAFSQVFLQYYEPHKVLLKIKKLLQKIGIKYVFICLDDFSEIQKGAMKVFVDTIIAPLNNWSDEFFKFKIAAYPNRVYLGEIDPQKIEQVKLDYYDLYKANNVSNTQKEAVNNVKRLLTVRCKYFCKVKPGSFFLHSERFPLEMFYQLIFDVTANVPRNIGWILWYAFQNRIAKGKKIAIQDIQLAAERFYLDTIKVYFSQNKYMREAFSEKLEKFHLNEVLNNIIELSKNNKTEIGQSESKVFQADKSKPPTSHFYVEKGLENILNTLELNFFITKYSEQKDQDGKKMMNFYSLNYGICQSEDINYGKGSDRKYVIQRRFNYSNTVRNYIADAKEFVCANCASTFPYEMLNSLELFDMLCPKCRKGICKLNHVEVELNEDESIQLLEFDIRLLNSLNINEPQYASALAQELDCSYQKVSRRASELKDKELIKREKSEIIKGTGKKTYYSLTDKAKNTYFKEKK